MTLKKKDSEAQYEERVYYIRARPSLVVHTTNPLQTSSDKDIETSKDGNLDVAAAVDNVAPASGPPEKEDKETRRIVRKIDLRLLPTLAIIYAFALIDRVNLPNVSIPYPYVEA